MKGGTIAFVCVSARKGIPKHAVSEVRLVADHGIDADAHAGDWHRQVSLLAEADIEAMRSRGLALRPGAFGENVVLRELELDRLGMGSRLALGETEVELTQIGKACHTRCAIYYAAGDCIMPRLGVFARVVRGGVLRPGDPAEVVAEVPRSALQAAVLTVSDRCAAGTTRDTAGPAAAELVGGTLRARVAWTGVVPDDPEAIAARLRDLADRDLALVLTVGGTGLGARDITPEATRGVLDREVPGLAEAMRAASSAVTPNAWLSRAVCGVRRRTLIVNLPGSRKAAVENLAAILPALPHALAMLRDEGSHPQADAERDASAGTVPEVCP